ncbi:MAG: hypothetical protein CVV27_02980 [Candidatus Melainabacteria bacterium HGW-Melainabacteria-1]|nr:MAG: hypothetical protein CVV27_02980 [Candidatus Melainabacteria bacterium HGW-Melainabacteria-1]
MKSIPILAIGLMLMASACQAPPLIRPSPSVVPTATSIPLASPSPLPSHGPTATPFPNPSPLPDNYPLSLSGNVLLQRFRQNNAFPNGLLQSVKINEQGDGQIVWHNPAVYRLQASSVQDFQVDSKIQDIAQLQEVEINGLQHRMGPAGQHLLAWSTDDLYVAGWPLSPSLWSAGLSAQSDAAAVQHGYYRVKQLSVNDQGMGHLIVTLEYERGGPSFASVYRERGSRILRIPVADWKVQLQPLESGVWKTRFEQEDSLQTIMRFSPIAVRSPFIRAVAVDENGSGLVVYQDEDTTQIVWSVIEAFNVSAVKNSLKIHQDMNNIPYDFRLSLDQGQGYLSWAYLTAMSSSLHFLPVLQGKIQVDSEKTLPHAPLDYSLQTNGTGLMVWNELVRGHPVLKIQKLESFALADRPYVMTWPDKGIEVISAKIGLNGQGDGLLSFATVSCTWSDTGCVELARLDRSIWARKIKDFKPEN